MTNFDEAELRERVVLARALRDLRLRELSLDLGRFLVSALFEENLRASLSTLVCVYMIVSPMFAIARSAALTSSLPMPRPRCVGLTATSDKYALSLGVRA